jgi:hypothetical protein
VNPAITHTCINLILPLNFIYKFHRWVSVSANCLTGEPWAAGIGAIVSVFIYIIFRRLFNNK